MYGAVTAEYGDTVDTVGAVGNALRFCVAGFMYSESSLLAYEWSGTKTHNSETHYYDYKVNEIDECMKCLLPSFDWGRHCLRE